MESTSIGIREAKIHLSRLLKMVKQGKEIILTEHGQPVGKIVPIPEKSLPLEARIQKLENKGVIEPDMKKKPKKIPLPISIANGLAQRYLREDRDGGR